MKKPDISPLIVLTLVFAVFLTGFFYVRNYTGTPVQCSVISPEPSMPLQKHSSDSEIIINLNTATQDSLCTLPGIGETLARRIIAYRNANGPFLSVEELLNIEGIGAGKLEAILDYITTGGK